MKISVGADGGPCSQVCSHLTLRSAILEHFWRTCLAKFCTVFVTILFILVCHDGQVMVNARLLARKITLTCFTHRDISQPQLGEE